MPYDFFLRGGYVEIHLFGVLGAQPETLLPEEWEMFFATKAVLYDYSDVEAIEFDPHTIAYNLSRNVRRGIRVAAVSSNPAWYGVNRQIDQLSEANPNAARLFHSRDEAVAWLEASAQPS